LASGGDLIAQARAINVVPVAGMEIDPDLADAGHVPADTSDVFINHVAFHVMHQDHSALYHSFIWLKHGGSLLCTFSCIEWCPKMFSPVKSADSPSCPWFALEGICPMQLNLLLEERFELTFY
jgi:hypothetical protein